MPSKNHKIYHKFRKLVLGCEESPAYFVREANSKKLPKILQIGPLAYPQSPCLNLISNRAPKVRL